MLKEKEGWRITNYHQHVQSSMDFKFENDKWYEIGFRNQFAGNFVHQGIRRYENKLSSMGVYVSGIADQYGRILEEFVNDKNELDLRPTGHCISVYH